MADPHPVDALRGVAGLTTRALGPHRVRGRGEPVELIEVLDPLPQDERRLRRSAEPALQAAADALLRGAPGDALQALAAVDGDPAALWLRARAGRQLDGDLGRPTGGTIDAATV